MNELRDETVGGFVLRKIRTATGFRGTLLKDGKAGEVFEDSDLARLRTRLRNEAGRLHPDYWGMDAAIGGFLSMFREGFKDAQYLEYERDYKRKAVSKLNAAVPLSMAGSADAVASKAVRSAFQTNMLSRFEFSRMHELLGTDDGPAFVRSAALFAEGHIERGIQGMAAAMADYGRMSWPIVTYLPYLWAPDVHMFLKPQVTQDFATRVNHDFASAYSPELNPAVYESLRDLVAWTKRKIAALEPEDNIDVQSFIWVVGAYSDSERTDLDAAREAVA